MSVIEFLPERRRRRSGNTYEAIRLQLEHIFERRGLRCFTLGDDRGLTLAHAGHGQEAEVMAAYAPLLATTTNRERRMEIFNRIRSFVPDASESTVAIRTFHVDGEVLHLCVLGEAGVQHTDLYRAISGVRRILGQALQAA